VLRAGEVRAAGARRRPGDPEQARKLRLHLREAGSFGYRRGVTPRRPILLAASAAPEAALLATDLRRPPRSRGQA
jgi:hypothetical protein